MIDERLEVEEPPRHRKRAKRVHVRSDHRHEYEQVCIDGHGYIVSHGTKTPLYWVGSRCRVCGRLQDATLRRDLHEPPEGMRLLQLVAKQKKAPTPRDAGWGLFSSSGAVGALSKGGKDSGMAMEDSAARELGE